MAGEIKSEKDVALKHADKINAANTEFRDSKDINDCGLQLNSPVEAMRKVFHNAGAACSSLCYCLNRDADRIKMIAETFEEADNMVGTIYG